MKFEWFLCLVTVFVICFDSSKCSSRNLIETAERLVAPIEWFYSEASDSCKKVSYRKSDLVCNQYRIRKRSPELRLYIFGGRDAHSFEFPSMAALGFYNPTEDRYEFRCGGTLISPFFVLTAAHCIINPNMDEVKIIRVNTISVPDFVSKIDPDFDIEVKNVIVHEQHDDRKKINDIALIELNTDATLLGIKPSCLYTKSEDPPELEITGWGSVEFDGERSSTLQTALVSLIAQAVCKQIVSTRLNKRIYSSHVCAGNDDKNTCGGDSGGPLLFKDDGVSYVVGITSFGDYCGTKTPGVYTRVSRFLDWIEKHVWP